jgi:hypothetical protein
MKITTTLRTVSAIVALAVLSVSAFPQNSGSPFPAPNAATGFSTFSVPQNMGAAVNSASIDEHPVISPSGLSLYFGSDRPNGLGGRDIYVSQRATLSSAWGAAQNVGVLNTSSNEVPGSISPDGRELFMNSARPGGRGGVDLWIATRTDPNDDFGWSAPVNLGAVINSTFGEQNANYFVDPATGAGTLIFASDQSSGTANIKDFYQSTRNADGSFNPPTIIGELNSAADEARTAISRDGLEIFFSSNRLTPTANTQAMFVSTRASVSSPWSPPVPVGSINAGGIAPQPALSPDGTVLYFISTRAGGFGTNDIYSAVRVSVNRSATADFDGDGRSDVSVFRPSEGIWYVMESGSNTFRATQFGQDGDKIVPGDYDGDGRTDFAVFRPSDRNWYFQRSSDNSFSAYQWGLATDKLAPGDYDGDGRTDLAVYRDGIWFIVQSSNGSISYQHFGLSGDIPVAAANIQ